MPHGSSPARQRAKDVPLIAEVVTSMISAAMAGIQSGTKAVLPIRRRNHDASSRTTTIGAFLHLDGLTVETEDHVDDDDDDDDDAILSPLDSRQGTNTSV